MTAIELYRQSQQKQKQEAPNDYLFRITGIRKEAAVFPANVNITLGKKLGEGMFGEVYEGILNGKDRVVIKFATLYNENKDQMHDNVSMFLREAIAQRIIAQKIETSAEICKDVVACALDIFITPQLKGVIVFPFQWPLSMKNYISGVNRLKNSVDLTVTNLKIQMDTDKQKLKEKYELLGNLFIMHDLIRDIMRLHAAKIAHLDLKPDNILVTDPDARQVPPKDRERQTLIIDLGTACADIPLLMKSRDVVDAMKRELLASIKNQKTTKTFLSEDEKTEQKQAEAIENTILNVDITRKLQCLVDRGSPDYASPGVLESKEPTFTQAQQEDLYAIGIIMFELIRRKLLRNDRDLYTLDENNTIENGKIIQQYILQYLLSQQGKHIHPTIAKIIAQLVSQPSADQPKSILTGVESALRNLINVTIAEANQIIQK